MKTRGILKTLPAEVRKQITAENFKKENIHKNRVNENTGAIMYRTSTKFTNQIFSTCIETDDKLL